MQAPADRLTDQPTFQLMTCNLSEVDTKYDQYQDCSIYSCFLCSGKHFLIIPLEFILSCHSYQETEQCNLPARKYQVVLFSFTLEEMILEEGSVTFSQLRAG